MNIRVSETANFPPRMCAVCGCTISDFFIDLGIQLEVHFNPAIYNGPGFDGAVYLCSAHWENLMVVGNQQVGLFLKDKLTKEENSQELTQVNSQEESQGKDEDGVSGGSDFSATENDRASEQDNREPTTGDSESDSNGPDEAISSFVGFFKSD